MPRKTNFPLVFGLVAFVLLAVFTGCNTASTSSKSTPSAVSGGSSATTANTAQATTSATLASTSTASVATSADGDTDIDAATKADSTASVTESAGTAANTEAAANATTATVAATTVSAASCTKLNLNTVTGDQLLSGIPNMSSRMVREFQEYRPYTSILQFRKEIGKYVDAATVADYEKYVFVPVDANNADADTLKQIPGVTDAVAADLIKGRPYASTSTFLDALGKSIDASQITSAGCFVAAQ